MGAKTTRRPDPSRRVKCCPRCLVRHRPPTDRQLKFALEYLIDLDPAAAYARAGFIARKGRHQGSAYLFRPAIQCAIRNGKKEQMERTAITADRVLGALLRIAEFDVGVLFDSKGELRPVHTLPPEARRSIAAIEMIEEHRGTGERAGLVTRTRKVKLPDKIRALELLGKHLKLYTEVFRVETQQTLRVRIEDARERIASEGGQVIEGQAEPVAALPEGEGVAHG